MSSGEFEETRQKPDYVARDNHYDAYVPGHHRRSCPLNADWAGAVDLEEKYDYIDSNFIALDADLSQAHITVRDNNILSKSTILAQLKTECAILDNETVNQMFASNQPVTGAENAIASAAIYEEKAAQLRAREQALQQREDNLNESVA